MASARRFKKLLSRVLSQASTGLDIEEIVRQGEVDEGRLSGLLRTALASFVGETKHPHFSPLPYVIELTLGDRTYRAPRIIVEDEIISGQDALDRVKAQQATSGKDDGEWFLDHQDDLNRQIPLERRGEIIFCFTEWPNPDGSGGVAVVIWGVGHWFLHWELHPFGWDWHDRPVRRITSTSNA